jgi:hypothetical protein
MQSLRYAVLKIAYSREVALSPPPDGVAALYYLYLANFAYGKYNAMTVAAEERDDDATLV